MRPKSSKCEAVVRKMQYCFLFFIFVFWCSFLSFSWCRADLTEPRARYCCQFGTEARTTLLSDLAQGCSEIVYQGQG